MLYTPPRDPAELSFLGLVPDDFAADDTLDVWPENWPAVKFFVSVPDGAWSLTPSGRVFGLRPEALNEVRKACGLTRKQWREMYADVQTMEAEALKTMNQERK